MEEERTPVAITVAASAHIFVVCDDGTIWVSSGGAEWKPQAQPIPGTKAAKEQG